MPPPHPQLTIKWRQKRYLIWGIRTCLKSVPNVWQARMLEIRMHTQFQLENLKGELGAEWRILKWILNKHGVRVWSGFNCLRTATNDRVLWTQCIHHIHLCGRSFRTWWIKYPSAALNFSSLCNSGYKIQLSCEDKSSKCRDRQLLWLFLAGIRHKIFQRDSCWITTKASFPMTDWRYRIESSPWSWQ
jgi:hypothetical protein